MSKPTVKINRTIQSEQVLQAFVEVVRKNLSLELKNTRITRGGDISRVWRGIAAAERAHLSPIKLNAVIMRGLNLDDLSALAALTIDHEWHIRFIELMPIGNTQEWGMVCLPVPKSMFPYKRCAPGFQSLTCSPYGLSSGTVQPEHFIFPAH